jgi:uncharacterized protein YjiS (DUF1127 family)
MPFPTFPAPYGRIPPSRLRRFDGRAADQTRPSIAGLPQPSTWSSGTASALRILPDAWHRLIARARRWQRRRAMHSALHELDDHMLRDLGFHRSEITSVCAEIAGDAAATRMHTLHVRVGAPY